MVMGKTFCRSFRELVASVLMVSVLLVSWWCVSVVVAVLVALWWRVRSVWTVFGDVCVLLMFWWYFCRVLAVFWWCFGGIERMFL